VLRLERLTDCVFSIVLIAVVLLPAIPYLSGGVDASQLWHTLPQTYQTLLVHLLSIFALFALWMLHHYEFHYLTRASGGLAWLNGLLLLFLTLAPITTSLLDGFASSRAAVLLYEVNLLAVMLLLLIIWRHAAGAGLLFGSDIPSRTVQRMRLALSLGVVTLLITAALAAIVPNVSLVLTFALFLVYAVVTARGGYALELHRGRTPSEGL